MTFFTTLTISNLQLINVIYQRFIETSENELKGPAEGLKPREGLNMSVRAVCLAQR